MKPTTSVATASATFACATLALAFAACAGGSAGSPGGATPAAGGTPTGEPSLLGSPALRYPANAAAPNPDPRIGLKPGFDTAGEAIWNLRLVSHVPASQGFTGRGTTGSDIAFTGSHAILGNYRGFQIWNIANPARPTLAVGFICPTSQGDPSVYGNLLFVSGENAGARNDCGTEAITDTVSMERFRGVRIFDISDLARPKLVANVQTCRGSHTHTVVRDPDDDDNVYVYVSGYSSIRSAQEVSGCQDGPPGDERSARFRIEIIQVPLANPAQARVVNSPHLLADLTGRTVHAPPPSDVGAGRGGGGGGGGGGRGGAAGGGAGRGGGGGNAGPQIGQSGCHDITVYSEIGLAGGACSGYGLVFDIRDVRNPKRLLSVADSNMSFWHSATFSNDGDKLLFSDEWGGGSNPRCRSSDPLVWGGNAIFTLEGGQLHFKSYYKMPAAQTEQETCTAHNGSLIPIPGREVMVQSFYQGGITVFDWTDPAHPFEMAFFDRGPSVGGAGGFWSSYWYNGVIVGSDEGRGMDIWELTPGPYLSQNEIDAAKTVRMTEFNAQDQQRWVWPPSFALARAYLDQLERNSGLPAPRIAALRSELTAAERASGNARSGALSTLAASLTADAVSAADRGRVQRLMKAIQDLGNAS
jgi:hypothetical protein